MTRARPPSASQVRQPLEAWFAQRGWAPAPFQREVWRRYGRGESGLVHAPTGSGKTLAVFGGPLAAALAEMPSVTTTRTRSSTHLRVLWVTPLRALANDSARALREAVDALQLPWRIGLRTADANASDKRLARQGKLNVLVTTPESLALLLSYPNTADQLIHLQALIVDEWHELLASKRGVLLQLCLARIRNVVPSVRIWGVSATLGNLEEARAVLLPHQPDAVTVSAPQGRSVRIRSLIPKVPERFPWSGGMGLVHLPAVVDALMRAPTSLLFANTRALAELWHRALSSVWPESLDTLALHHGSIDPALRALTEQGLREGRLRCVVATSSLDLGVDFPAVDQVLQLGSPKGVARLVQRAGRARHRPGETRTIIGIPVHGLELLEYAAARTVIRRGITEQRRPLRLCMDVLAQHLVTLALAGGFQPDALYAEVRGTHAFAELTPEDWQAVLDFIRHGSSALEKYPDFHRVVVDDNGLWRVISRRVALHHRLSIGTIVGESSVTVKFMRGATLGQIEESFVSRLRPRDRFHFAGRQLELVRLEDMCAYVRQASGKAQHIARWNGTRLPMSHLLAEEMEALFTAPPRAAPELRALQTVLQLQDALSGLPRPGTLLAECIQVRQATHLTLYPFAGARLHEGLAALLALRWGREHANTFSFSVNEYGLMIRTASPAPITAAQLHDWLTPTQFADDLAEAFNLAELARRQFREIARIAGLLVPSMPGGTRRTMRQIQASSGLLFDVLQRYDPEHILLQQAQREVLHAQLDTPALQQLMARCQHLALNFQQPTGFTPLAFSLWADALRGQLSTEDWRSRIQRAATQLERRHGRSS